MVPPDQPAFSSCVIKGSLAAAGTLFVVRSAAAKTGDAGAGAALSDTALTADPAETDVFFTADVPVLCGAEGPVAAIAGVFFCKACPHAENTRSTSRRSPQRSWERYRIVLRSTIWKRYCSQNENPRLLQTQKIQMQELHRPPSRKGYCVRNLPNFFPSVPDLHRRHCIRSNVRIREIRTDNHLTQSQFGEKISVSQDTVSLWEKGTSVPTTEYVIRIAETFFVSADYLLGLSEY